MAVHVRTLADTVAVPQVASTVSVQVPLGTVCACCVMLYSVILKHADHQRRVPPMGRVVHSHWDCVVKRSLCVAHMLMSLRLQQYALRLMYTPGAPGEPPHVPSLWHPLPCPTGPGWCHMLTRRPHTTPNTGSHPEWLMQACSRPLHRYTIACTVRRTTSATTPATTMATPCLALPGH